MNSTVVRAEATNVPASATNSALWALPAASPFGELGAAALSAAIGENVTVRDLVAVVSRANPAVSAARTEWKAAVKRSLFDGAWFAPEAKIARRKLNTVLREVVLAISTSAAELWYLDEVERIAAAQRQLLSRWMKGGGAAQRANGARISAVPLGLDTTGGIEDDTVLIAEAKCREKARLNTLLDRPPHAPVGKIAVEAPACQHREDSVARAERAVETTGTRLSLDPGSIRDFLEAQDAWYDLCLTAARAEADRVVLRARLEVVAGGTQVTFLRSAMSTCCRLVSRLRSSWRSASVHSARLPLARA